MMLKSSELATFKNTANLIKIGIGEKAISRDPKKTIVTYGLGSCVAVILFDPSLPILGMIHCLLPYAHKNQNRARQMPETFVDRGLPLLFSNLRQQGANRIKARLVGGGSLIIQSNLFEIGKRNTEAAREILGKERTPIISEDIGGSLSRTVFAQVATGEILIRSPKVNRS